MAGALIMVFDFGKALYKNWLLLLTQLYRYIQNHTQTHKKHTHTHTIYPHLLHWFPDSHFDLICWDREFKCHKTLLCIENYNILSFADCSIADSSISSTIAGQWPWKSLSDNVFLKRSRKSGHIENSIRNTCGWSYENTKLTNILNWKKKWLNT